MIPSVVVVETEDDDGNFFYKIYALDETPMNDRYEIKFVSSLPTLEPDKRVSSYRLNLKDNCNICTGNKQIETYLIPCMHGFCNSCIVEWFKHHREHNCPMCRSFASFTGHIYFDAVLNLLPKVRIKRL